MLSLIGIGKSKSIFHNVVVLLVFISCITFHTQVFADIAAQTAEEYRALGYEAQQKGSLNEALTYYTKATSLGLENAVVLNDMGVLYEEIDFYNRAEQYYLKAIQVDGNYLPPYINLAYFYQRHGKDKKAEQYFKIRYERGDSADPWAQKAKKELIKLNPKYQEWIKSLEADFFNRQLEKKSQQEFYQRIKQSQEYYKRGKVFFKKGSYKKAMREYDQALALAPKNPKIIDARGKVILEMAKESVREQSKEALRRLEVGDTLSARHEIQKILTTIPKKPILISR